VISFLPVCHISDLRVPNLFASLWAVDLVIRCNFIFLTELKRRLSARWCMNACCRAVRDHVAAVLVRTIGVAVAAPGHTMRLRAKRYLTIASVLLLLLLMAHHLLLLVVRMLLPLLLLHLLLAVIPRRLVRPLVAELLLPCLVGCERLGRLKGCGPRRNPTVAPTNFLVAGPRRRHITALLLLLLRQRFRIVAKGQGGVVAPVARRRVGLRWISLLHQPILRSRRKLSLVLLPELLLLRHVLLLVWLLLLHVSIIAARGAAVATVFFRHWVWP